MLSQVIKQATCTSQPPVYRAKTAKLSIYHVVSVVSPLLRRFVPAGSPPRGGDVTHLPTSFNSVLVSVSVVMVLSTVFHSINSPDNSPFSHSVLPVLCLIGPFKLYSPDVILCC